MHSVIFMHVKDLAPHTLPLFRLKCMCVLPYALHMCTETRAQPWCGSSGTVHLFPFLRQDHLLAGFVALQYDPESLLSLVAFPFN